VDASKASSEFGQLQKAQIQLEAEMSTLRSALQQKEAFVATKTLAANAEAAKVQELQADLSLQMQEVQAQAKRLEAASEVNAALKSSLEQQRVEAVAAEAVAAELRELQSEVLRLKAAHTAEVQSVREEGAKSLAASEEKGAALEEVERLTADLSSLREEAEHSRQVSTQATAEIAKLAEQLEEQQEALQRSEVLEVRALDAERQARSACVQVVALEDLASVRTAELETVLREKGDGNALMEQEVMKAMKRAKKAEAEAAQARRAREEALEEMRAAEAKFEEEMETLQEEVEAAAERESEFEAAERSRHAEELGSTQKEADEWQEYAVECAKRMQELEEELRLLKGDADEPEAADDVDNLIISDKQRSCNGPSLVHMGGA